MVILVVCVYDILIFFVYDSVAILTTGTFLVVICYYHKILEVITCRRKSSVLACVCAGYSPRAAGPLALGLSLAGARHEDQVAEKNPFIS